MEELSRRIEHHAVALGDVEKAVLGEGNTVGDVKFQRWGKVLDLIGHPVAVAVHNRPDLGLFGADKENGTLRCHGHVTRIRDERVKFDLEALGHRDPFEDLADIVRLRRVLVHIDVVFGACDLKGPQLFEIGLGNNRRRKQRRYSNSR